MKLLIGWAQIVVGASLVVGGFISALVWLIGPIVPQTQADIKALNSTIVALQGSITKLDSTIITFSSDTIARFERNELQAEHDRGVVAHWANGPRTQER